MQIIYCDCCQSAKIETTEILTTESYYMCTICREYKEEENKQVKENNFKEELVIDYSN